MANERFYSLSKLGFGRHVIALKCPTFLSCRTLATILMTDKSQYLDALIEVDKKYSKEVDLSNKPIFELLVITSFIKALEINLIINKEAFQDNSFLFLSNLRGTCEELITLKFLHEKFDETDRNTIIDKISRLQLENDILKQFDFLQKYRPFQPTIPPINQAENPKNKINEILSRNGISTKNKLPPTEQMARMIGFSEFYEFMYRACSSFVHFKPGILLRTVWYDNQNVGNISISNLNKYYWDFSSFYGVYQFLVLYKEFKSIIDINNILTSEIDILKESFKSRHFPEVITFEELNIKRPKTKWTVVNLFLKNQLFE